MFVKTLNKSRFGDIAYFKRDYVRKVFSATVVPVDFWIPLDEFGEKTKHAQGFNSGDILDWIDEGVVEIVKNPKFTQVIVWPRIFVSGERNGVFVYFEDESSILIKGIISKNTHMTPDRHITHSEITGKERQKYVDALNLLQISSGIV